MDEGYLPEKWRDKVFRFQAGGYSGCTCHPAALIVDRDGEVHLVGSDGGAGGLDENDWYCRKCRACLDEKGVNGESDLLYGPKKDDKSYKEFLRFREECAAERRRRERRRVLEALEGEYGRDPDEICGWDHEFELIGEIDTEEKVRETCRNAVRFFYDVHYRAGIAEALRSAGYDGAGFVCTMCGRYEEGSDFERFTDSIDPDAYRGIGGVAVAHTSILCDACRQGLTCPHCFELSRHALSEGDAAYDHMPFREAFLVQWLDVCENCADSFFRDGRYRLWREALDGLETTIGNAKAQMRKYVGIMREAGGWSEEDLADLEERNRTRCEESWRVLVNELRDRMEKDVSEFFRDADLRAGDRLGKGERYVW